MHAFFLLIKKYPDFSIDWNQYYIIFFMFPISGFMKLLSNLFYKLALVNSYIMMLLIASGIEKKHPTMHLRRLSKIAECRHSSPTPYSEQEPKWKHPQQTVHIMLEDKCSKVELVPHLVTGSILELHAFFNIQPESVTL